jgi:hypothetical protein
VKIKRYGINKGGKIYNEQEEECLLFGIEGRPKNRKI